MNEQNAKVYFSPYFAKRKAKMNKELIKKLEEAAASDPVVADEHGEYRLGVFLHRNCIVNVSHDDDLWSVQIISESPVTLPIMEEVRYKFLPNDVVMARLFPPRDVSKLQHGVVLYEIPAQMIGEEESQEEEK